MRKVFGFLLILMSAFGARGAVVKDFELIERVFVSTSSSADTVVVRELRPRGLDGSAAGIRSYRLLKAGLAVGLKVERFGQSTVSMQNRLKSVSYLKVEDGAVAERLATDLDRLFAVEKAPRGPLMPRVQGQQNGSLEIEIGSGELAALDAEVRAGHRDWERQARDYAEHRQAVREAQIRLVDGERRLTVQIDENYRRQSALVAPLASAAVNRSGAFLKELERPEETLALSSQFMNAAAQQALIEDINRQARSGNWGQVAQMVADLESPLMTRLDPATREWLKDGEVSSRLRGQFFFDRRAVPSFRSAEFEHEKNVVSNLLQASSLARPSFADPKTMAWLRASAFLLHAAAMAEARGRLMQARDLLTQSRAIAAFYAGADPLGGLRLQTTREGGLEFVAGGPTMGPSIGLYSPEQLTRAGMESVLRQSGIAADETNLFEGDVPTARSARLTLKALGSVVMEGGTPTAKVAGGFLLTVETMASNSEAGNERLRRDLGVLAMDIALGFIPPVSMGKSAVEFVTGRHALTNEPLSTFDRGLALVNILMFGEGTLGFQLFKALEQRAGTITGLAAGGHDLFAGARRLAGEMRAAQVAEVSVITALAEGLPRSSMSLDTEGSISRQLGDLGARMKTLPVSSVAVDLRRIGSEPWIEAVLTKNTERAGLVQLGRSGEPWGARVVSEADLKRSRFKDVVHRLGFSEGNEPDLITPVTLRRGDRLMFERNAGAVPFYEIQGVPEARMFGPSQPLQIDDNGFVRF